MKRSNYILQFTAMMSVICTQSFAQSIAQSPDEVRPLIIREVRTTPEKAAIPLDRYSKHNKNPRSPLTIIPAGTYEVGDDQPLLKKLTDVADQLNNGEVTGDIIYELNATYDGTSGEMGPIVFNEFISNGGTWTVTIRVKAGVTARSTSYMTNSPMIVFNGADHIVLDGRPGGTGDAVEWNIHNSHYDGTGILFINDAQYNTVRNIDLISLNKTTGVITFGSTTGTGGNDNNTVSYCNIHDDGTDSPGYGIYSSGNLSSRNAFNSGNIIENCNIYNIFNNDSFCESICLDEGSTGWNIRGNSFYQTIPRISMGWDITSFNIIDILSGDGYIVSNNYIGGSEPHCGGAPWLVEGTNTPKTFYGISYSGPIGPDPNLTDGNIITNISFKYGFSMTFQNYMGLIAFAGIQATNGIHNITNNTFGSATGNGSIYVETGPSIVGNQYGLFCQGISGGVIDNNIFGGITFNANPAMYMGSNTPFDVYQIRLNLIANTVPLVVSNNLTGSLTTPNSILCNTTGTTGYIRLQGISVSGSTGQVEMNVTDNTVANMTLNGNTSGAFIKGIIAGSYVTGALVSRNRVHDLTNNAPNTNTSLTSCAMLGMQLLLYSPATVSQNEISNLSCTANQTVMAGCYVQNGYFGNPGTLERNFIHNLTNNQANNSSQLYGLYVGQGNYNVINNMISIGSNPDGSPLINSSQITGIQDLSGINNYYNNSVFIGGMATGTTGNSSCFNSSSNTLAKNIFNNIFVNNRWGGTAGQHYAIRFSNLAGLIVKSNYNLMLVSPMGGTIGYNGTNLTTLDAWKAATGLDMSSGTGDPAFISPMGSSGTLDLHLQGQNPAEGSGIQLPVVVTDYDGEARSGLTPADIGADAGNFSLSVDIFGPAISYTPVHNSPVSNLTLTDFAVITDNAAVEGGDNAPRLYYKKSTDAGVFAGNTSSDNGWKYVKATSVTSPYSFTIDYSLLYGGIVNSGDLIQYFVVAQDAYNNFNSFPLGATAATFPPVQNISVAPPVVNQYLVTDQMIGGVIYIPFDYPTLTGAGGLFEKINNSLVNSDLLVFIAGNVTEPGTNALNQFSQFPENSHFKMSIYPFGPVMCNVTGAEPTGLIRFNGADNITIGGNYGFQGTFLKFVNTSGPVFSFQNDANFITFRELIIEGASTATSSGLIFIGGSDQTSGNHDLTFTYNRIRNISTGPGIPYAMIASTGTTSRENYNINILNNELFNFSGIGINITSTGNGNFWTIENNHFYCSTSLTASSPQYGIYLGPGAGSSGNVIRNNFIGGAGPEAGYGQWITRALTFYGIYASVGTEHLNYLENNVIRNIQLSSTTNSAFTGINATGWFHTSGNIVGGVTGGALISKEVSGNLNGITLSGPFDLMNEIEYNTVAGIHNGGNSNNTTCMSVTGMVKFTDNRIGPAIDTKTQSSVYGFNANIRGYFGHNTIEGVVQSGLNPGNFYGIYLSNSFSKMVEANKIINCGPTSDSYGSSNISGIYNALTGNGNAAFINNIISLGHGISNAHSYMGIYDAAAYGNSEFYFNSISQGGTSSSASATFAYYKDGRGSAILKDNIFANFHTGAGHHCAIGIAGVGTEGALTSDYNDIYSSSGQDVFWNQDDYMDLSEWQEMSGNDLHSVSVDPLFTSSTNLHPCSQYLEDAGISIPGVPQDFSGTDRGDPPDIGAFEFDLPVASITTGTPDDFCNGEWLTAHSSTGPATYEWSTGSTSQSIFLNIAENEAGTYSVYVKDENGCSSLSAAEYIYEPEDLVSSYTLLGFQEAQLGESNTVLNGSMGLTGVGLTLSLKKNVVVNGPGSFVKASNIDAHPTAVIREKIYAPVTVTLPAMQYNTVTGNFTNMTVPDNTTVTISNNYINLTVGQNCNVTLNGSIFGNIQADKGTTLTFNSPSMDISSLKSQPGTAVSPVKFVFADDAVIRVKTKVDLDNYVIMNPDQHKVIFYIAGNQGQLQLKPTGTMFNGSVYVPSGMIKVISDGIKTNPAQISGKFIARRILAGGKYIVWNWYDCGTETQVPVTIPLFTDELVQTGYEDLLKISPVPNDGSFRVQFTAPEEKDFVIQVYNSLGVEIRRINAEVISGVIDQRIDLRPVTPGIYTLVLMNENSRITGKVIVR